MAIFHRRNYRRRLILVALLVGSLVLITLDFRRGPESSQVRAGLLVVVQPISAGVTGAIRPVQNFFGSLGKGNHLKARNEALQRQVEKLQKVEVDKKRLEAENKDLRETANYRGATGYSYVTARVVGVPATNFDWSLTIDAGADERVASGNPVLAGQGLIGRVIDVSPRGAKVMLLADPQSSVGVRDERSGVTGVVTGQSTGPLRLEFVDANADVKVGDIFVTSGFDKSRFPANLTVGKVTSIEKESSGLVLSADVLPVEPMHDFVSVMMWNSNS